MKKHRCFYTGIELEKRTPDNLKVPAWQAFSKEHLVSRASSVFQYILTAQQTMQANCKPCSEFVNNGIGSYHLAMKVRFKALHEELYPHFHQEVVYCPSEDEFTDSFRRVHQLVVQEFQHNERMNCAKTFLNSPVISVWELVVAQSLFPGMKFRRPYSSLVSEMQ